jgi:hypothetical protein
MPNTLHHPDYFIEVRVHKLDCSPGLTGMCAGYENGEWRCRRLASHLIEWLPEFALTYEERENMGSHNAVALIAQAARAVYTSEKYQKRGEVGELLLHIAMCQVFHTVPAISKYFFKDSTNDTVKGFDAVHVVATKDSLELWLGEVKLYGDIVAAISDVVAEINEHTQRDYLRAEFAAITNKIEDTWPQAERLKRLLHRNTSLDEVFDRMCIPVFLAYESPTIKKHNSVSVAFKKAFVEEISQHHGTFSQKQLPKNIRVHVFLFPIASRSTLLSEFDERLKACQAIAN